MNVRYLLKYDSLVFKPEKTSRYEKLPQLTGSDFNGASAAQAIIKGRGVPDKVAIVAVALAM